MQCVILAGGAGTRMKPHTDNIPKALIPIAGKPFLEHQLQWLSRYHPSSVVLSIGYKGTQIREYINQNISSYPFKIQFVDEEDCPLGTGGALRLALNQKVLEDRFLVLYGDSFLPIDFSIIWTYFQHRKESALMTVCHNRDQWDKSNVCFDGGKVLLYDKKHKNASMTYIDYGLSGLSKLIVEREVPDADKFYDLADVFHRLSIQGNLAGYEVDGRFFEIGSHAGLADFETFVLEGMRL